MKNFLLNQAMEKKNSQQQEKIQNKEYSKIWNLDAEKGLQQEKELNEKVYFIFLNTFS